VRGEKIGQLGAEFTAGEIGEAARAVQRLVGWSCGDKADHEVKLLERGQKARKIFLTASSGKPELKSLQIRVNSCPLVVHIKQN
jgi:hypothetical protein